MSDFNRGFNTTFGGCSAILFTIVLIIGIGFTICAGCMVRMSSIPTATYKGTIR